MHSSPATPHMSATEAHALVRPLADKTYAVDYSWRDLKRALESYETDYGLNLTPDFQRGHVWTERQQAHYIENVMRGVVVPETMVLQFNCPHWNDNDYAGELPREMQILDGLQRLTAVLEYMQGRVRPFGRDIDAFDGTDFDTRQRHRFRFRVVVYDLRTRAALLQHYLDINAGGTPHSEAEIERVKALLATGKGN